MWWTFILGLILGGVLRYLWEKFIDDGYRWW